MAPDLGREAQSGLQVQLCGDAHLQNFGFKASPGRALLFNVNDIDETVSGPFEWDLKRLVCSLDIASQPLAGISPSTCIFIGWIQRAWIPIPGSASPPWPRPTPAGERSALN